MASSAAPPSLPTAPAAAHGRSAAPEYVLRLYVTGATPASARAVVNTRRFCEAHLHGRYALEIVDIAGNVPRATQDQVVATPTLLKMAPPPLRRLIGDMSDEQRMRQGLNVPPGGP